MILCNKFNYEYTQSKFKYAHASYSPMFDCIIRNYQYKGRTYMLVLEQMNFKHAHLNDAIELRYK